jgi:hypothetical protein
MRGLSQDAQMLFGKFRVRHGEKAPLLFGFDRGIPKPEYFRSGLRGSLGQLSLGNAQH